MVVDEKRERVDLVVVDGVQSVIDGEFLRRSFGIDRASLSQLSLSADMRVQSLHRTICLLSLWFLNALAVDLHGRVLWNDVCSSPCPSCNQAYATALRFGLSQMLQLLGEPKSCWILVTLMQAR